MSCPGLEAGITRAFRLADFLLSRCRSLRSFRPVIWAPGFVAQTVFGCATARCRPQVHDG